MAVLFGAGLHVPVIPSFEVVGSVKAVPLQTGPTGSKVGVVCGVIVTVIVVVVAHWPAAGVNVYVVVAVLFIAGDHVPVMLFVEVPAKVKGDPLQIGPSCVNVGVVCGVIVTVIVVVVAH